MSQYLSSFIIDPVVRQARRFSRSATDSPPLDIRTPPLDNGSFSQANALDATSSAAHEIIIPARAGAGVTHSDTISEEESPQLRSWQSEHLDETPLDLIEIGESDSEIGTGSYVLAVAGDDDSNTPVQGFSYSLESATSSFSNSARSLIDATMSPVDPPARNTRTMTQDVRAMNRSGDSILPADDGMSQMRKRILTIQKTNMSNEVKARLVHDLMTEKHNRSQQNLSATGATSPGSIHSTETQWTPSSPSSMKSSKAMASPPPSGSSNTEYMRPFQLSPQDLNATYYRKPYLQSKDAEVEINSMDGDETSKALGCEHYKRNIKLQCSKCYRWYTCRFCHDAVEDHMLNRRETKNMLCMLCGCAQPASEGCTHCHERAAWYYCDVCKLWDDDVEKSIYHCSDCGICRIGEGLGKDFFHCKTCSACMSISIRDTHRCIERSTDCDCPICGEYMFTSPHSVVFMKCGHSIHSQCYQEHMKSSYRCPICSRSVVNMERQFWQLERAIDAQPMPPEFRDTQAWVYCNDCSAKTVVKYHWLGLKCAVCDSYNTAQLQLLGGPGTAGTNSENMQDRETGNDIANSRPSSRGRSRFSDSLRQPTISEPPSALAITRDLLESTSWPNLRSRNAHSTAPNAIHSMPPSPPPSGSDPDDSMDTDEEELEFWGGESPRSRLHSPSREQEMAIDDSEDDEDDSDDEDMSDTDELEEDDFSQMEIIGHR